MEYFKERDYFGIGEGEGELVSKWKRFQQKWLKRKQSKGSDTKRSKFSKYVYGFAVFEYNLKSKTEKVLYYFYEKKNGVYALREEAQVIKDGEIKKAQFGWMES
uniref:AlNc14C30G2811 protein n=1 Tax=Albugo laibachii Nc14 TaxID=890382 RepID=F0W7K5_9STRA|nr:AlNc14C30G2811 [Albugo laibachii Nc14]|eukprot:CCA17106.1 AlNc14C30G2811 [Albugo laibachii Nc14]